jgi:hypothetical protein
MASKNSFESTSILTSIAVVWEGLHVALLMLQTESDRQHKQRNRKSTGIVLSVWLVYSQHALARFNSIETSSPNEANARGKLL